MTYQKKTKGFLSILISIFILVLLAFLYIQYQALSNYNDLLALKVEKLEKEKKGTELEFFLALEKKKINRFLKEEKEKGLMDYIDATKEGLSIFKHPSKISQGGYHLKNPPDIGKEAPRNWLHKYQKVYHLKRSGRSFYIRFFIRYSYDERSSVLDYKQRKVVGMYIWEKKNTSKE